MLSVIALYTIFGSTFALSKLLLTQTQPLFAVGSYMTIGGILLLSYTKLSHKKISINKPDWFYLIQLAIFNVIVPYGLRLWSLQSVSTVKAALLFNLSPFLTAFFAFLLAGDRLNFKQLVGLTIGFIGMIPVLLTTTGTEPVTTGWFISTAEFGLLISTASISYSLVIMQKLVKKNKCPVVLANGVSMAIGGLLTLCLSLMLESPIIKTTGFAIALYALLQAVVINVVCANWRAHLLKQYSSTFMAFASLLAPLSAMLYGWFFYHELLSWNFALSFAMVLFGLGIYYSHE